MAVFGGGVGPRQADATAAHTGLRQSPAFGVGAQSLKVAAVRTRCGRPVTWSRQRLSHMERIIEHSSDCRRYSRRRTHRSPIIPVMRRLTGSCGKRKVLQLENYVGSHSRLSPEVFDVAWTLFTHCRLSRLAIRRTQRLAPSSPEHGRDYWDYAASLAAHPHLKKPRNHGRRTNCLFTRPRQEPPDIPRTASEWPFANVRPWPGPGAHGRLLRGHGTRKRSVRASGSFGEALRAGLGRGLSLNTATADVSSQPAPPSPVELGQWLCSLGCVVVSGDPSPRLGGVNQGVNRFAATRGFERTPADEEVALSH